MARHDRFLTPEQAAATYDRIGRWQDTQAFYERPAVDAMLRDGRWDEATSVVEVGCGTGALAERLLTTLLPGNSTYVGLDLSATMVRLASQRLLPWSDRARVERVDGHQPWPVPDASADRVVAAYVLDLLSPQATAAFFAEAGRVLRGDGLLATVSLAPGSAGLARVVTAGWSALWRADPRLTGGCRPVDSRGALPAGWRVEARHRLTSWAVTSEVLLARPAPS